MKILHLFPFISVREHRAVLTGRSQDVLELQKVSRKRVGVLRPCQQLGGSLGKDFDSLFARICLRHLRPESAHTPHQAQVLQRVSQLFFTKPGFILEYLTGFFLLVLMTIPPALVPLTPNEPRKRRKRKRRKSQRSELRRKKPTKAKTRCLATETNPIRRAKLLITWTRSKPSLRGKRNERVNEEKKSSSATLSHRKYKHLLTLLKLALMLGNFFFGKSVYT